MSTDKSKRTTITLDGEQLENVDNFTYLGARIDANGKTSPDIRRRLALASNKLTKMLKIWKSENIRMKMKVLRTCIFPTATYGCETWTISKIDEKRINAFEMKCYRKILRIPWTAKETNNSVKEQLRIQELYLLNSIKKLKLKYFGHLKRHNTLERIFLEGMVEGKRERERKKERETERERENTSLLTPKKHVIANPFLKKKKKTSLLTP